MTSGSVTNDRYHELRAQIFCTGNNNKINQGLKSRSILQNGKGHFHR